ncbi:TPA: metal ABC transporter substrate-binding protein, partial [Mannheimia haemolytica]|nr:metal ABC transporter substrate-binding protein [Mannheimia haemolytica]
MKLSTIKKALVLTFGLSAAMAMAEPFKVVTT